MKKNDVILISVIVIFAVILLCAGLLSRNTEKPALTPPVLDVPADSAEHDDTLAQSSDTVRYSDSVIKATEEYLASNAADSYLLVTTTNNTYFPIPLNGENSFRITQADGSENVIHIGKNSFYMESSNCDNQNCVEEGEVTLENKDTRILFNMVICLPHQLYLELLTPEETRTSLLHLYTEQEAFNAALDEYLAAHPEMREQTYNAQGEG